MPRVMLVHHRRRRHHMRGRGILDWLRKAHDFIKKHKLISRIGSSLGAVGVPYAGTVGKAAGVLGYGRKIGYIYRGGALRPAGGRRRHHRRMY